MEHIKEILLKYVDEKLSDKMLKDFTDFINNKSQRDQILFYFKFESYIKNSDLVNIFPDLQIKTLTQRLVNSNLIINVDKEGKEHVYHLTDEGEKYIDRKIFAFLDKNFDYKEDLTQKRKELIFSKEEKELVKNMAECFFDCNIKPDQHEKIIINMKLIAETNPDVADQIYADFKKSIEIIKTIFQHDVGEKILDHNILFIDLHDSEFRGIHHFDREFKGLVFTKGLITSKKESIISKTLLFKYKCECEECKYFSEELTSDKPIPRKKGKGIICPNCGDNLYLVSEDKINQLESKITDVDTGISFPLYIRNSLSKEFASIQLGDEVEVIGFLEDKLIEIKNGVKETTKALVVNSFKTTDYVKELSKEEKQEVINILEKYDSPREYLINIFEDYIADDKIKYLFIIQQLTKWDESEKEVPIHIALMGDPGVGKNVLIKKAEEYFPNCDGIVGADITDAGFKGTVNRDTGIKEIGLAKKCQNGTLCFNEFDKFVKSAPNGKKAASQLLNASITEQEIRLNKAGIRIRMQNLDLRHNIIFNPLDEKKIDEDKIPYDFMSEILDKSLLSRMLPLYISKDNKRSKEVFDLQFKQKEDIEYIEPEIYKLVLRHLRAQKVEFTEKAKDLLSKIYDEFLKSDKFQAVSVERIGQMLIQLSKGISRLNGKNKCGLNEVKEAHDIYMYCLKTVGITMANLESLFLEKGIDDLREINIVKEYILNEIEKNKNINLSELHEIMSSLKKENVNETIKNLISSGEYIELPKGRLKKNV